MPPREFSPTLILLRLSLKSELLVIILREQCVCDYVIFLVVSWYYLFLLFKRADVPHLFIRQYFLIMFHRGVRFGALVHERVDLGRYVAKILQEGFVHGVFHPGQG